MDMRTPKEVQRAVTGWVVGQRELRAYERMSRRDAYTLALTAGVITEREFGAAREALASNGHWYRRV